MKNEPIDRGNISLINAGMILVFAVGQVYLITSAWNDLNFHQQQTSANVDKAEKAQAEVLALVQTINATTQEHSRTLDETSKKLDSVTVNVDNMKSKFLAGYPDKFGTYDSFLAWKEFDEKNPSFHFVVPNVYLIRQQNPPQPNPTQ